MAKLDGASLAARLDAADATLCLRHAGLTPNLAVQIADFLERDAAVTAVDLTGNAIGSHGAACLAASLQKNEALTKLTLAGCELKSDVVAPFAAYFHARAALGGGLRHLDLSNNQIDDDAASQLGALVAAVARDDAPVALDLRKNWFSDDAVRSMAIAIQDNHALQTLRLEGNQVEDATVAKGRIDFFLQRNRRERQRRELVVEICELRDSAIALQHVALVTVDLSLADAQQLSDALRCNRSLLTLQLRDNALPVEGTRRIIAALEGHATIRSLTFHDNDVGDAGVAAVARLLQRSRSLTALFVVHSVHHHRPRSSIASRGSLASLHKTLASAARPLHSLALVNCGLGDLEIGLVVTGAAWACRLEKLELHNNRFGDRSAHMVARLVRRCSRLHTLDVSGNELTLSGALVIASAVQPHSAMRTLLLGRVPWPPQPTPPSLLLDVFACLRASATLVRVDVATLRHGSRCQELLDALRREWTPRRDEFDRARRRREAEQLAVDTQRAQRRAVVRRLAVHWVCDLGS